MTRKYTELDLDKLRAQEETTVVLPTQADQRERPGYMMVEHPALVRGGGGPDRAPNYPDRAQAEERLVRWHHLLVEGPHHMEYDLATGRIYSWTNGRIKLDGGDWID